MSGIHYLMRQIAVRAEYANEGCYECSDDRYLQICLRVLQNERSYLEMYIETCTNRTDLGKIIDTLKRWDEEWNAEWGSRQLIATEITQLAQTKMDSCS